MVRMPFMLTISLFITVAKGYLSCIYIRIILTLHLK